MGDYNLMLSPSALNQLRVGYSRRDLKQTSLQNGGINVPGLPTNSFASVLPIFTVAGYQQIGPTTAANSRFTTSITEYLDTFTLVRRRHTIKFGLDIRRPRPWTVSIRPIPRGLSPSLQPEPTTRLSPEAATHSPLSCWGRSMHSTSTFNEI